MAKYNVVTNVDTSSKDDRDEGKNVAAAISYANNYGPAVEEAICPSRTPDALMAASLTCDDEYNDAAALDQELAELAAELKEFDQEAK